MNEFGKIFCTSQLAQLDEYAIEKDGVTSLELMEGAAVVFTRKLLEFFPKARFFAVVAGPGNNGGDGFACARFLMDAGKNVKVYDVTPGKDGSVARETCRQRYLEAGGRIVEVRRAGELRLEEGQVVVDALFGAGLNRPVKGVYAEVVETMNESGLPIVALDMPSGLMGEDNSRNDRTAIVKADYTYTFQFMKLAFLLPENAEYVGELHVLDINLQTGDIEPDWYCTTLETVQELLPESNRFAHKGMNGRGLLIAGSRGMMGAAVLGAKAAVRSGVGVLHCHVPKGCGDIMQVAVPEAILEEDESECCFSALKEMERWNAIAVGPGIGQRDETVEGLRALLQHWKGRLVLDADALNILATHKDLLECVPEDSILTPHIGEFERLTGKSENDFERLNKLLIFAKQYRVNVVLKGAYSAVATADGELYFNMSGNPGMAKGGCGDVLTGVLLALAANGIKMKEVARIGVFAHGLAGDLLAERVGMRGISSGLLAEEMGAAWSEIEG